jgi:hypothetical protein
MSTPSTHRVFTVPKQGNSPNENEDRLFIKVRRDRALVALSDGATESALSRVWADMLVGSTWKSTLLGKFTPADHYLAESAVERWLTPLREQFQEEQVNRDRPWYSREKLRKGAHATFLAFRMFPSGRWRAASVGDTCMFQVVQGNIETGTMLDASAFGNHPSLVSSDCRAPLPQLTFRKGKHTGNGTKYVFVTDALAVWILDHAHQRERLDLLLSCEDDDQFNDLVSQQRALGNLRNDDTTAIILRC